METLSVGHYPCLCKREGGSILPRGLRACCFESSVEAAHGTEAGLYGDLGDVEVGGDEEALRVGDAVLSDVVYDADGETFAEETHGIVWMQVDCARYLSNGKWLGIVVGDEGCDALDGAEFADGQHDRRVFWLVQGFGTSKGQAPQTGFDF